MCNLLLQPMSSRALSSSTAAQPLGYVQLLTQPPSDCDVARALHDLISPINVMREQIEDIEGILQKWIQEVEIFPILTYCMNRHSRRSIPDDSRKENTEIHIQHLVKLTERIDRNMQSILNLESTILNENRRLRNHLLRV